MPPGEEKPGIPASAARFEPGGRLPAGALLAAAWLASLWGLLCVPLNFYDEPILLLGGRLVAAGWLPYRDFYTHYGPFGYALISWLPERLNPGIAYRLAQGGVLGVVALLAWRVTRTTPRRKNGWLGAAAAAFAYLALAIPLQGAYFLAYGFVLAALALLILAESSLEERIAFRYLAAAGAALGLAGLVRPGFGLYAAAATVAFHLAIRPPGPASRRIAIAAAAGAAAVALVWLALFRQIPLADAWFSTIVIPGRLHSNSSRFVAPAFSLPLLGLPPGAAIASAATASLYTLATLGALRAGARSARVAAAAGVVVAAGLTFSLGAAAASSSPGRFATPGAAALFLLAFLAWRLTRPALETSTHLRASAICGLAAVAFLHYDLTRADLDHFVPALALALASCFLAVADARWPARIIALGLLVVATRSPRLGMELSPPASIGRQATTPSVSTATGFWSRFPASMFPVEAVDAVRVADREADPRSRFVALASDHRRSEGSAVVLFLLSQRLPYTKWYQYDPGVQTAPFVQARMIEELERSGSGSAVVWSAMSFGGPARGPDEPPSTPLDQRLLELYPRTLDHFGGLQVRLR